MKKDLNSLGRDCVEIVQEAGQVLLSAWDRPHEIRHKGRIDLVTETDLCVENFLREKLSAILPEAEFYGEESAIPKNCQIPELCWIVDPVDGTTNFVHRIPIVGISVALWSHGKPVLGVVNAPVMGECFYAATGQGAYLNDKQIAVSSTKNMVDALVGTGVAYNLFEELDDIMGRLERVLSSSQGARRLGAASLNLAYVACGRLDAFYESGLKPWDVAAGCLLVSEAGGRTSGFNGDSVQPFGPVLASNGYLHATLVNILADDVFCRLSRH